MNWLMVGELEKFIYARLERRVVFFVDMRVRPFACTAMLIYGQWTAGHSSDEPFVSIALRGESVDNLHMK